MKTGKPTLLKTIAGLFVLILVAGGLVLAAQFKRPLGPALGLPTVTASASPVPPSDEEAGASLTPEPVVTATPQPLCGGPALMTLLAVGSDSRANSYLYGLSDVMRIVRVDFTTPRVTVLEMPRDLWVEIPDISSHYNITHGKLNQAYLYGNPGLGYYDGPGQGPGLLARTLDLNFGLRVDHYAAVNMRTFVAIVDELGGLDVYLPYDVSTSSPDNPNGPGVPAGQHHLDGETALTLARIRQYNVFGRAQNQDIVLCALRKKLTSPAVLPKVPAIIQDFLHYVQTDLSLEQIDQLACLATQMDGRDIAFISFPVGLFKQTRVYDPQLKDTTFIFDADFDVLRDYIGRFEAGTWPDPHEKIENTPSPGHPDSAFTCD
jgi:LCP family protein required for cell wall assembly